MKCKTISRTTTTLEITKIVNSSNTGRAPLSNSLTCRAAPTARAATTPTTWARASSPGNSNSTWVPKASTMIIAALAVVAAVATTAARTREEVASGRVDRANTTTIAAIKAAPKAVAPTVEAVVVTVAKAVAAAAAAAANSATRRSSQPTR